MRNPHDVLIRPLVSEKSLMLMEENKYSFLVLKEANKIEIKHAVEKAFPGVKVLDVTTRICVGKVKRQGRFEGKRPDLKKAIVKLAPGHSIPIFEGLQ